jgi:hypothetical protein
MHRSLLQENMCNGREEIVVRPGRPLPPLCTRSFMRQQSLGSISPAPTDLTIPFPESSASAKIRDVSYFLDLLLPFLSTHNTHITGIAPFVDDTIIDCLANGTALFFNV